MRDYYYYGYILASKSRILYVGMTNSIDRRVIEHKTKRNEGFTSRYNVNTLVYYECFGDVHQAIAREKQIKGWRRDKKIELIESQNPTFRDLAKEWFEEWQESERVLARLSKTSR